MNIKMQEKITVRKSDQEYYIRKIVLGKNNVRKSDYQEYYIRKKFQEKLKLGKIIIRNFTLGNMMGNDLVALGGGDLEIWPNHLYLPKNMSSI